MNIVARVHLYPPSHCAGAERMLHAMLRALVERGHRVQVHLSRHGRTRTPYALDGVEIFPRDSADWQAEAGKADVLMTHLDNTSTVISAAIAYDKPLVQVLHNTHAPTRMWANCRNDLLVYNTEWMRDELGDHPNGIVVHPPVFPHEYRGTSSGADKVTLVNLNYAKGGLIFAQLASLMPDVEFLGVEGAYGEQLLPNLPNVELRAHGADMRQVYSDSHVVLMPSSYESYGRVGVEAMCSGIPVIATATPGLQEALGTAGIFIEPNARVTRWQTMLRSLLRDPEAYYDRQVLAKAHVASLTPDVELTAFCDRVEALA